MGQTQPTKLIVQLNRTGDIVQTIWATKNLPREVLSKCTLIVRQKMASPITSLLQELEYTGTSILFYENIKENFFIECDAIYNLSFCKDSMALIKLLNTNNTNHTNNQNKEKEIPVAGPYYDSSNQIVIHDKISQYIYSFVLGSTANTYPLAILFYLQLTQSESFPSFIDNQENRRNHKIKRIYFHPTGSSTKKVWPRLQWSLLLYELSRQIDNIEFCLLGGPTDEDYLHEIKNGLLLHTIPNKRNILVVTENSIEYFLNNSENAIFVGHDSLFSQITLLSKNEIPSFTISLGPVNPFETSPFHQNALTLFSNIECYPCKLSDPCEHLSCHKELSTSECSQLISSYIKTGLSFKEWINKERTNFSRLKFLQTMFFYDGEWISGNTLRSALGLSNFIYSSFYRTIFDLVLFSKDSRFMFDENKFMSSIHIDSLKETLEMTFQLCEFGISNSTKIIQLVKNNKGSEEELKLLKDLSSKIEEIELLFEQISQTFPFITPVHRYYKIKRASLANTSIIDLAFENHRIFNEESSIFSALYDLLKKYEGVSLREKRNLPKIEN